MSDLGRLVDSLLLAKGEMQDALIRALFAMPSLHLEAVDYSSRHRFTPKENTHA